MTKSILIIDDNDLLRTVLVDILEGLTYQVFEACNGKEGIEFFRKNPTDIVITDIFMPEKDGLEVITELRRDYPQLKIIAISGLGKGSTDFLNTAKLLGASHYLMKPFNPRDIVELVSQLLSEIPAGDMDRELA